MIGTVLGVAFFNAMRRLGQLDLVIVLSYITLLGVGGRPDADRERARHAVAPPGRAAARRAARHTPGISACRCDAVPALQALHQRHPAAGLSTLIGFIGAVLGIGGGFLMVPALIYMFRVPTAVVVGTSLFQILFTMVAATMLHAVTNQSVDIILAILLVVGGVFGAQFGARAGQNIRGEHFRLLLALIVLAVGFRFASEIACLRTSGSRSARWSSADGRRAAQGMRQSQILGRLAPVSPRWPSQR